jgi:hypothetical protein
MIIVKLQGGLGNQLFQWAYGKSLSLQLDQSLYLDLSFLNIRIPGITKREYELYHFDKIQDEIVQSLSDHNLSNFRYQKITDDTDKHNNKNANYYLDGYFQNEKYFIEFEHQIRNLLQIKESAVSLVSYLAQEISECHSLSLHVRRTDYLLHGYHQPKNMEYYHTALEQIKSYDKIFIFSDDIEWCKTNIKYDKTVFIENLTNIQDLYLMSLCKNNIIANSSFSWWAAWLNSNPGKTVVCPNSWFRGVDANSFVPSDWIKI